MIQDIFLGKQFVLDVAASIHPKTKNQIRDKITKHNGVISYIVTKKSDYVIAVPQSPAEFESYKTNTASKYNIPVIKQEFIDACLESGQLIDCNEYSWMKQIEDTKINLLEKGKIQIKEAPVKLSKEKPVKTWNYLDINGPNFHEGPYKVIKAVYFEGKKKQQGIPFTLLELHVKEDAIDEPKFCIFTHQGFLEAANTQNKQCRYFVTVDGALNDYVKHWKKMANPPSSMKIVTQLPEGYNLGSDRFRANEFFDCSTPNNPHIQRFVDLVYKEAEQKLKRELKGSWKEITSEKLEKAAGLLTELQKKPNESNLLVPDYNNSINRAIPKLKQIDEEFDLLQLIRARLNLSELATGKKDQYEAKYQALRCDIEYLERESDGFKVVEEIFQSETNVLIKNVYRVNRPEEAEEFKQDLGNIQTLFHGTSYCNIASILSRGLLLPTPNKNMELSLGFGLYFTNEVKQLLKYAIPSETSGTRLLLIHKVALGRCYETYHKMPQLENPPPEFDSVWGVKDSDEQREFGSDEFVVYDRKQQKICYVVEFQLSDDKVVTEKLPKFIKKVSKDLEIEDEVISTVDIDDIIHSKKKKEISSGLQSASGKNEVTLRNVAIQGKLFDLAAEVVIIQEYFNNSSKPIEAKYYFPLDEMAVVCSFEAFLNGRHIVGRVDEKEQAQQDYRKAVSSGKSALLMDQEAPDIFSISVGNVQPKSTVLIKITYVTELDLEGDMISFRLPGTMCSNKSTKDGVTSVESSNVKTLLELYLEMPYDIRMVTSTTHRIRVKKTAVMATVQMLEEETLDSRGFQLLIGLAEIHCPRMWTEEDEEKGTQACMLSFYPEFEADEMHNQTTQVVLVLDASNSMINCFPNAQKLATLCLQNLPQDCKFNVVAFGSNYQELYPDCVPFTLEHIQEAKNFISKQKPTKGDSFSKSFFKSNFLLGPVPNTVRNIVFVSDGHLNDESTELYETFRANCIGVGSARIFTLAVGATPNRHLLKNLAKFGAGDFESFDNCIMKSMWVEKVERLMTKLTMPVLTDIYVEWQIFDETGQTNLIQAPRNVTSLFNGSRLIVYGLLRNASSLMAVLKARVPGGREMSTVVSPYNSSASMGKMVHRLATRALVRDWESGALDVMRSEHESLKHGLKTKLVELSKVYSIVTPFTSFVAIDDNDSSRPGKLEISFKELVSKESVDKLNYLDYNDDWGKASGSEEKAKSKQQSFNTEIPEFAPKRRGGSSKQLKSVDAAAPTFINEQYGSQDSGAYGNPLGAVQFGNTRLGTSRYTSSLGARIPYQSHALGNPFTKVEILGNTNQAFSQVSSFTPDARFALNPTPQQGFEQNTRGFGSSVPTMSKLSAPVRGFSFGLACKKGVSHPPPPACGGFNPPAPPPELPTTAFLGGISMTQETGDNSTASFHRANLRNIAFCPVPSPCPTPIKQTLQTSSHQSLMSSTVPSSSTQTNSFAINRNKSARRSTPADKSVHFILNVQEEEEDMVVHQIHQNSPDYSPEDTVSEDRSRSPGDTVSEDRSRSPGDTVSEDRSRSPGDLSDVINQMRKNVDRDVERSAIIKHGEEFHLIKRKCKKRANIVECCDIIVDECPINVLQDLEDQTSLPEDSLSSDEEREEKLEFFGALRGSLSDQAECFKPIKRCFKKWVADEEEVVVRKKPAKKSSWVQLNVGCINYGSGLPFFSMLYKKLNQRLLSSSECKEVIIAFGKEENWEDHFQDEFLDEISKLNKSATRSVWNAILWQEIKAQLKKKGLYSLPVANVSATCIAVLIVGFLFDMIKRFCPRVLPLKLDNLENVECSVNQVVNEAEVLKNLDVNDIFVRLLQVLVEANKLYPMLYRTIEIGSCWEEAYQKLSKGESLFVDEEKDILKQ